MLTSKLTNSIAESELTRAREFIRNCVWTFAKTYASFAPHEYIVKEKLNKDKDFEFLVNLIRMRGYPSRFGAREYIYLNIDGFKYWTMGNPLSQTKVINRRLIA